MGALKAWLLGPLLQFLKKGRRQRGTYIHADCRQTTSLSKPPECFTLAPVSMFNRGIALEDTGFGPHRLCSSRRGVGWMQAEQRKPHLHGCGR